MTKPSPRLQEILKNGFERQLAPGVGSVSSAELLRSALAAGVALVLAVLVSAGFGLDVVMVTPVAASAVILFALPKSPLAQPWPFVMGNLLSAVVGLLMAGLVPFLFPQLAVAPLVAGLLAVPLAIVAMGVSRSLHPPAGAQAFLFATSGAGLLQHGWAAALAPLTCNLVSMVLATLLINNLLKGRRYPGSPEPVALDHGTQDVPSLRRTGVQHEDLHAAIKDLDSLIDIGEDDLIRLYDEANRHAFQRLTGLTVGDIMSRDVQAVDFATPLDEAWQSLTSHNIKALPVIDRSRRVVGIITRLDFIRHCQAPTVDELGQRLRRPLSARHHGAASQPEVVGQIMAHKVFVAREAMPVAELVAGLTQGGRHHIPVVNARHRLVGIVTQSDLLAALFHHIALGGGQQKAGGA